MNPLFLLQGIGMVTVALIAVLVMWRRSGISTTFILLGGISWFAATVLKSIASVPLPQLIIRLRAVAPETVSEPLLWLIIGLLTGVFECGVSLVIISRVRRLRSANWREALGYGLGFGALEAILLGVYSFAIVLLTITAPDQLPPELLDFAAASDASLLAIPIPIVERSIVIVLHTFHRFSSSMPCRERNGIGFGFLSFIKRQWTRLPDSSRSPMAWRISRSGKHGW